MVQLRYRRRTILRAGAASFAGVALGPRVSASADGSVLRVRDDSDIQVLDPAFEIGGVEEVINDSIFVRLTQYVGDATNTFEPYAAKSIEQTGPVTIDFTLHEGLQWTNGFGELTVEDVKFSFERIADPALESPWSDYWAALDRVEVIDKYTGRIIFKSPYAAVWAALPEYTGNIVCKAAVEKAGGRFTTDPLATCGPYVIKEWLPKQKIVLQENPDWKGARPDFPTVEVILIDDPKSAELAFEAGEVDYTQISISSIARYREAPPPNGTLFEKPGENYVWLGINVEHEAFQDIRVRQAVQYAVDIDAILQGAYGGLATRSAGIVPPSLIGHRAKNFIAARDIEKAKSLLAEAGKPDGFSCTLTVMNQTTRLDMAQIIQANLAEVGIQVEILPYESSTFWNLGLESEGEDWKNLQLYIGRYTSSADPYGNTTWFTPEQVGEWNWERWNSPEFGELHQAAIAEADRQKRATMYVRMQDLMEESGAYTFITHEPDAAVFSTSIAPNLRSDMVMQARKTTKA